MIVTRPNQAVPLCLCSTGSIIFVSVPVCAITCFTLVGRMHTFSVALWFLLALPSSGAFSLGHHVGTQCQPQSVKKPIMVTRKHRRCRRFAKNEDDAGKEDTGRGIFDILSPFETKIPPEIRKEIYAAEGRTPAAKDRTTRVILYTSLGIICVLFAIFNGFLTELRTSPNPDGVIVPLEDLGFGWVMENPIASFLFMNKLGGGLSLLVGGGSALLAEAEFDTQRITAEKIYEEMVRRRTERESKEQVARPKKKKRRNKTLEALAEVLVEDESAPASSEKEDLPPLPKVETPKKSDNILDKMKDIYKRADTMAASQALLLNKRLEDEGILEKITDESGLKVIGKEAASRKSEVSEKEDDVSKTKKG